MLNYINIVTASRKYTVYSSLKAIEDRVPRNKFLKIHKSYIVAIDHINTIDSHQVDVAGCILPVSRSNKTAVLQLAITLGLK
jgi:two-component system, LytTR family, response regulator